MNKNIIIVLLVAISFPFILGVIYDFDKKNRHRRIVKCGNEVIRVIEEYNSKFGNYPEETRNNLLPHEIKSKINLHIHACEIKHWEYFRYSNGNYFQISYGNTKFDSYENRWVTMNR